MEYFKSRFTQDQLKDIRTESENLGISRPEYIRRAVNNYTRALQGNKIAVQNASPIKVSVDQVGKLLDAAIIESEVLLHKNLTHKLRYDNTNVEPRYSFYVSGDYFGQVFVLENPRAKLPIEIIATATNEYGSARYELLQRMLWYIRDYFGGLKYSVDWKIQSVQPDPVLELQLKGLEEYREKKKKKVYAKRKAKHGLS